MSDVRLVEVKMLLYRLRMRLLPSKGLPATQNGCVAVGSCNEYEKDCDVWGGAKGLLS